MIFTHPPTSLIPCQMKSLAGFAMQVKNTAPGTRLSRLAADHLRELSRRFPVMCSSDEFHFLPRARPSPGAEARLDSLDRDVVEGLLDKARALRGELSALGEEGLSLEARVDLEMLLSSLAALELDFGVHPAFRREPLIYLKIMGIGLAQALDAGEDALPGRLRGARRLAGEAAANISSVAGPHLSASLNMTDDLAAYLAGEFTRELEKRGLRTLSGEVEGLLAGLRELREFLGSLAPAEGPDPDDGYLERLLAERFRVKRGLKEIFEMGRAELARTLDELERTARDTGGSSDWQSLYWGHLDSRAGKLSLDVLYREEMESLRRFFLASGVVPLEGDTPPEVMETPVYLRSVRAAASYSAPSPRSRGARGVFYLLAGEARASDGPGSLGGRLAREYRFLTAHETYPGHHVLDAARLNNENPLRAAVESPLFYEGWATYAEGLLRETGYASRPEDRLAELKRRAWRAARLLVDVGPAAAGAGEAEGAGWLMQAGFTEEDAREQLKRFRLTRGYQLCYTLGCLEILRLREKHGQRLGQARFHRELLAGGQMPFHLADMRLEEIARKRADAERR